MKTRASPYITLSNTRKRYRKIPKISASMDKPPPPPPPPRGGLYLEIALKYKVKQSKDGKFPSNFKASQSILKRKFPSVGKRLRI